MTIMKYPKHRPTHSNVAEAKAQPLVKLVQGAVQGRKPGSAMGRVTIAADFDSPLEDFSDYR